MTRLAIEGNRGGDFVVIEKTDRVGAMVRLDVGHQCVTRISARVPASFVAAAIAIALDAHRDVRGVLLAAGWSDDQVAAIMKDGLPRATAARGRRETASRPAATSGARH